MAMSAGRELIFVRVGSDDPSAARRQTINQPPIGNVISTIRTRIEPWRGDDLEATRFFLLCELD